jgi:hypothetical protein
MLDPLALAKKTTTKAPITTFAPLSTTTSPSTTVPPTTTTPGPVVFVDWIAQGKVTPIRDQGLFSF